MLQASDAAQVVMLALDMVGVFNALKTGWYAIDGRSAIAIGLVGVVLSEGAGAYWRHRSNRVRRAAFVANRLGVPASSIVPARA